jgi:hypothetical protein
MGVYLDTVSFSVPLVVARGASRVVTPKGFLIWRAFLGEPWVRFAVSLVEVLSRSGHLPKVEEGDCMLCNVALSVAGARGAGRACDPAIGSSRRFHLTT